MEKIPNENWQMCLLRDLYAEESIVLVPTWLARVTEWTFRIVGMVLVLIGFTMIPIFAWWIACLIFG